MCPPPLQRPSPTLANSRRLRVNNVSGIHLYRLKHSTFKPWTWRRHRLKCSGITRYILAVVLLQTTLMLYNLTAQGSTDAAIRYVHESTGSEISTTELMKTSLQPSHRQNNIARALADKLAPGVRLPFVTKPTTSKTPTLQELEQQYMKKRPTKVNRFVYNIRLSPNRVCLPDTRKIFIVHTHPTYASRRNAIRETWGGAIRTGTWPHGVAGTHGATPCCQHTELVFVVGLHHDSEVNSAVEREYLYYNDIVQGDFMDAYRNMTLKSLLDLKFVLENCPGVDYVIKSDDDMIINIPYLYDVLKTKNVTKRSIMGPLSQRAKVYRSGVWMLTTDEYPMKSFPPYEAGSAYVITADLVRELFDTAEYVPWIFIDDVYITGILGKILKVQHVRQSGFAFWGSRPPTACDIISRKLITGTKMHPQRLVTVWQAISSKPNCTVIVNRPAASKTLIQKSKL